MKVWIQRLRDLRLVLFIFCSSWSLKIDRVDCYICGMNVSWHFLLSQEKDLDIGLHSNNRKQSWCYYYLSFFN